MVVNSANPVDSENFSAELNVGSQSAGFHAEAPPPYSPSAVDNQPPIIHQTIIIQAQLKDVPMFYMCPRCQERVFTKVEYVSSKGTHMLAGFICGLTLWCMMCCLAALPYYCRTFKQAEHYCPNCNDLLGTYSKL